MTGKTVYRNVLWSYEEILQSIQERPLSNADIVRKSEYLKSSEVSKYSKQLIEMKAIKEKEKDWAPLRITSRGREMLRLLRALHKLMEGT
jgi:predicted transcriptional regulator